MMNEQHVSESTLGLAESILPTGCRSAPNHDVGKEVNRSSSFRWWQGIGLALLLCSLSGCGGCDGTSQQDMMRAAMRRSGGDDEEDEILPSQLARLQADAPITSVTSEKPLSPSRENSPTENNAAKQSQPSPGERQQFANQSPTRNTDSAVPIDVANDSTSSNPTNESGSPQWQPVTSIEARRQMSIDHMRQIIEAFTKTIDETKAVPGNAIYDANGQPLLSWRVAILPHLGYGWLYDQFRLDEPWNSPHNRNLLDLIPDVYRDPESNGHLTVYQVPVGTFTAFPNLQKSILAQRIEDGVSNTVLLVEVDREHAVPWTEPRDLEVDAREPMNHLGGIYDDGFFVAWGSEEISCIRPEASKQDLFAMFSIDGGEPLAKAKVSRDATAEVGGPAPSQLVEIDQPTNEIEPPDDPRQPNEATTVSNRNPFATRLNAVGIAANWNALAIESLRQRHMRKAFAQQYVSLLLDDPKAVVHQYGWSPALSRPALAIRWGIGADVVAPPARSPRFRPIEATAADREKLIGGFAGENEVEKMTGELGLRLLAMLRNRQDIGKFGTFTMLGGFENQPVTPRANADQLAPVLHYPGVHLLGTGSRRVLIHVAERNESDVLVMFEIDVKLTRSNQVHNSTKVRVIDVQTGRELLELSELNNIKVEYDRNDRLKDDPVVEWSRKLKQFLDEELALQDLPELSPEQARERLKMLTDSPREQPLPWLAEAQLYLGLGIISEFEYREACQAITGQQQASVLVDGTDLQKQEYLEQWIPSDADAID